MTDIVERLRSIEAIRTKQGRVLYEWSPSEAADEIERLRALLDGDATEIMRLIRENEWLRRALEPKP